MPISTSATADPKVFLITGANRGIGLEYARQVLAMAPDTKVIATCRNVVDGDELAQLGKKYPGGRLEKLELDIVSN
jgi:NAD(P)-dependent dehydrogenase (short-subunit alcohol dehydrogenase family)